MVGQDVYPVGTTQSLTAVGSTAQTVQSVANLNARQSVVVLQAFSWAQYSQKSWSCNPFPTCAPFPTMSQMRQMRDLALQNAHPRLILWYSFFDIARSGNPTAHWADLVQAASPISTNVKHISIHKKVGK